MFCWVCVFAFKDFVKVLGFDDPVEVGGPAAVVLAGEEIGLSGESECFDEFLVAFFFDDGSDGFFAVFVHAFYLGEGGTKFGEGGFDFFEIIFF